MRKPMSIGLKSKEDVEARQRELRLMIAFSWCFEAHDVPWMWRGLKRLEKLRREIEQKEGAAK